ncbi:MAG: hypothetical protein PF501_19210 [Salinisphaera sp.]|nr:hypothetical protein [Salinisphaera sp.]
MSALSASPWLRRLPLGLLDRYIHRSVDVVAARLADFNRRIEHAGLATASSWALLQWATGVSTVGQADIPTGAPLLIVCNHPGVVDALALLSQLEGHDVRVLVATRPLLDVLPALRRHLTRYRMPHGNESVQFAVRPIT